MQRELGAYGQSMASLLGGRSVAVPRKGRERRHMKPSGILAPLTTYLTSFTFATRMNSVDLQHEA